mmetsp:Transcript_23822/g.51815  ORF Transcript_23822/g.51815 Transcript_23822/m.51815 type:complete len:632 (+) Transcript_23822:80-1975(+)
MEGASSFQSSQPCHAQYGEHWGEGAARCFSLEADILDEDHAVRLMPVPDSFVCPISAAIMVDPVATVDGSVYERGYIERWFRERRQQGHRITSPITGQDLPSATLMPLVALQRAIEAYLAHRPELKREQMAGRSFEEAAAILQTDLFEKQAVHASTQDKLKRLKQANKDLLRGLHDAEQRIAQLEVELGRQSSPFQAAASKTRSADGRAGGRAEHAEVPHPPGTEPEDPVKSTKSSLSAPRGLLVAGVVLGILLMALIQPLLSFWRLEAHTHAKNHEGPIPDRWKAEAIPPVHLPWIEENPALTAQLKTLEEGNDEEKQKVAFMLRLFAAEHSDNQAAVVRSGALPHFVRLLGHETPSLREEAARVLWNLARNSKEINAQNQVAIGQAGAIHPLIRLLEDNEQRIRVVAAAVLNDLASDNPDNQVAITQGGAIDPLVRILKRDEAPALVMAASLLKSLAAGAAAEQDSAPSALLGAVPPLVALLRGKTLLAQEQAASTLGALAAHSPPIQAAIVRAGAVSPLVERLHGDMMKGTAIVALRNLATSHAENQQAIAEAGAILPLVKLLEDAMPMVREEAAEALWTLAQDNLENQLAIIRAGGSASMVALLKGDSQEQATLALLGVAEAVRNGA